MSSIRARMEALVEKKNPYALPKPLPTKKLKPALLALVGEWKALEERLDAVQSQIHGVAYAKADELKNQGVSFYSDDENDPKAALLRALSALYQNVMDEHNLSDATRLVNGLPES